MSDYAAEDAWAPLAERFVDCHYGSLRGRVRTHVINDHLRQHMGGPPQRVVDVGGGAGNQSIPLALAGNEVTIVDPSPAMLERATRRRAEEDERVARWVQLVEASGEDAPGVLGGALFDAVLCHGVLMYLDDPEPLVDSLCQLAAPAGVVSIVAENVEVMALRHAHEGDWAAAIEASDSKTASQRAWRRNTRRPSRAPLGADCSSRSRAGGLVWRASSPTAGRPSGRPPIPRTWSSKRN